MDFKRFLRGLVFLFGLLTAVHASGQEYNYARLSLLYGGSIPFNFNSIQRYTEGIEVIDGTVLGITMVDSNQVGTDLEGFDLLFRTFNGQATIRGTAGDLPLNVIRVRAENNLGLGSGTSTGYRDLEATQSLLFNYTDIPFTNLSWDTHQLTLSYECGRPVSAGGNGSLLGEDPDYYTVEIEVELVPVGVGF